MAEGEDAPRPRSITIRRRWRSSSYFFFRGAERDAERSRSDGGRSWARRASCSDSADLDVADRKRPVEVRRGLPRPLSSLVLLFRSGIVPPPCAERLGPRGSRPEAPKPAGERAFVWLKQDARPLDERAKWLRRMTAREA